MSAPAAPVPAGRTLTIRGTPYPVLLPKLSDPRLHLAAVITTLQVLGQTVFQFRVSIAQILISLLTCAVLEVVIAFRKQHVLMWPASAMLTGNGVAFILRVPGTRHGDWWSTKGWWIFMATAAVSLLSKYVITWRGAHIFNPSNIGLVLCFVLLGRNRAEPLDFWWGPVSPWLLFAFVVIVTGGLLILSRLKLLWIAVGFWLSFAAGIAVLAATGHAMVARWHLGPITGPYFWWSLLTSPEVLVFLFFMLTDPKTSPRGQRDRIVYAVSVGLLAALLIAPMRTEWASKVGLLAALTIVCAARPLLALLPLARLRLTGPRLAVTAAAAAATYAFSLVAVSGPAHSAAATGPVSGQGLPAITILRSRGVETQLPMPTARAIVRDLVTTLHRGHEGTVRIHLEPGEGQGPPYAVAQLAGMTYRLHQAGVHWALGERPGAPTVLQPVRSVAGFQLSDVAQQAGIDFHEGAFRYGVTTDTPAMMGGGLCWLDYNNDGWLDLFVVNSYGEGDIGAYSAHGGLPRTALFRNDHGHFTNVTASSGAGRAVRGEGCVAADFNGDGYTDLYITTAQSDELLWNNGNGTFTEGARSHGVVSYGWHSGAAVADVNGDGRPDLFVAGYTEPNGPIAGSTAGFPTNHLGVRDLLFLNEGNGPDGRARFREVGRQVGLDRPPYDHSLGALFTHVNGRLALYVANDEDPNRLYLVEPGPRFVDIAKKARVADRNAGMGIAAADWTGDGQQDLFVSNSRRQTNAVYESGLGTYAAVGHAFTQAFGGTFTGWGDSWVDLNNSGDPELVLASGAIPVTNLAKNAGPVRVLTRTNGPWVPAAVLQQLRTNGRGVAAADYDNDGRVDLAVNTIGGKLLLLHNTGPLNNWLTVGVQPFSPGAIVTVVDSNGHRQVREVEAGSSYLSSEDPRVHFGLGSATARSLTVRFPDGTIRHYSPPTSQLVVARKKP
jgi:Na+-translocating ferredoxin:NAD+ oxidoreductase RnfD subunit